MFRLEASPTPIDEIAVDLEITEGTTGHFNRLSQSSPVTISDSGVVDNHSIYKYDDDPRIGSIGNRSSKQG